MKSSINVKEEQVELSTGVSAQVLSCIPRKPFGKQQPPLIFIHGSFHAAWCWTEKYFPFFASQNYPVVALSLRGTGGTFAGEGVRKVTIEEHATDVASFLNEELPKLNIGNEKPILISHSFGGLAVMKYLEKNPASHLGGIITMCSVPPSGNGKMTMRFIRRSLADSWKITAGFAMKKCIGNASLCRQLFFGGEKQISDDGTVIEDYGVSDADIERYQSYFKRDTEATIDIKGLLKHLPSALAVDGRAHFLDSPGFPPCLVVGAERDFVVDKEGVEETATYYGLESPVFVDSPHDVMLGRNWQKGANLIHKWVQETVQVRSR